MTIKQILGFQGEYRWLSNFWPCEVWFKGIEFPSVEHAYVASKSLDSNVHKHVATIKTAGEAKRFGRTIQVRPDFNEIKLDLMYDFTVQKYCDEELLIKLLATGDAYIEETNRWGDTFWGVTHEGIGHNHLGKIIMKVRSLYPCV